MPGLAILSPSADVGHSQNAAQVSDEQQVRHAAKWEEKGVIFTLPLSLTVYTTHSLLF